MKKFIRYVMFGSIIYWIQIILTGLITEITGLWHVYSFLISLLLGWGASFFVHKHLTFQAKNLENTKFFIFSFIYNIHYVVWYELYFSITYSKILFISYNWFKYSIWFTWLLLE